MAIYDPSADDKLEVDKPKSRVVAWSITAVWDNGEEEQITDIPDWCAQYVDEFLTELEEEALRDQGVDDETDE